MSTTNTMSKIKFSLEALVSSVNQRAEKGVLLLVIDDKNVQGLYTYKKLKKVVDNWEDNNKAYITRAFNDFGVKEIIVASAHTLSDPLVVIDGKDNISNSLPDALVLLNKVSKNGYLVAPQVTTSSDKAIIVNFIKTQRSGEDYPLKGVLYNYTSDTEGIINFTGSNLTALSTSSIIGTAIIDEFTIGETKSVASNDYIVDVASSLCTLSANESITNHTAKDILTCDIKADEDTCVGNGELFLFNNGTDVVFSRGVNSKQTFSETESESLSKIRVIEVIDMAKSDIKEIFDNSYLGKVGNSYANRKSLISVLNTYLKGIIAEGYLSNDDISYCELDINATRSYLESKGIDTDDISDNDILKEKIDTHVFISMKLYIMDVIEDISIVLQYET